MGDDGRRIEAADDYLRFLTAVGKSPNTVRAYSLDLRSFFEFLTLNDVAWDHVTVEHLARFIDFLQRPPATLSKRRALARSSIARRLSCVGGFYEFHGRRGLDTSGLLVSRYGSAPNAKRLLAHVQRPVESRHLDLRFRSDERRRDVRVLTPEEVRRAIGAARSLRDKFLLGLLYETGVRIGEALGLRQEDVNPARRSISIVKRLNDNGARVKSLERTIPISPELIEGYNDYLDVEFGLIDSDYLFVNLRRPPVGRAMSLGGAYEVLRGISTRCGIPFTAHTFRHTFATDLLRAGVSREVVQHLLGHRHPGSTMVYEHLDLTDLRRALATASHRRVELSR